MKITDRQQITKISGEISQESVNVGLQGIQGNATAKTIKSSDLVIAGLIV